MGIRTNIEVSVQAGLDNDLSRLIMDESFQQLLDTLEHAQAGSVTLAAGESNFAVPFGDVAQARTVFIVSDGPLRVTPGGGIATSAIRNGAGGSYPTGFDGTADTLDIEIDGVAIAVTFAAGDQSVTQVINRINAAAALAGITGPGGVPVTVARNTGAGQLRLQSPTTGTSSTVEVLSSTPANVLTALGLSVGLTAGVNASVGQTPLTIMKPTVTSSEDSGEGIKAYLLATLQTSALTIDNLDSELATSFAYLIAGDVVTTPPSSC